ncbi:c-type cytochrome [Tepidimonas sp.]|uniref:c-type cytochrome n=1 Tax=Tepidimonas sp. TaxID=2002775 RepID=UPI002FE2BA61
MKRIQHTVRAAAVAALLAAGFAGAAHANKPWYDMGRAPTPAEIKAWDIDVRPDFKGLPKGSGSVRHGQEVWDAKCASCHGEFGESNEVFTPIVGGTTKKDIETGRVANLRLEAHYPQRTTLMKVPTISTLWDYINRAMPWNAPKSLSVEDVYGVVAYILHLGDIVPEDFVLSDQNIAEVQKRMPNRNGMTTDHGLWLPNYTFSGKPDVRNTRCMKDCPVEGDIKSMLPDWARDSHGNLLEQQRIIGPTRGLDTTKPPRKEPLTQRVSMTAPVPAGVAQADPGAAAKALLAKNACTACHGVASKIVGPGFNEVAAKHKGKADLEGYLVDKIKSGGQGVFGAIPMPPQPQVSDADAKAIAAWIAAGAK